MLRIFYCGGKEKVARGVRFTRSDRIPVKDPDGTWSFGDFPKGRIGYFHL